MKFGIDFDDVLAPFVEVAISLCNKDKGTFYSKEDIASWGFDGSQAIRDVSPYYSREEVLLLQRVSDKAKKFMAKLMTKGDVYIITAVKPEFMSLRAEQIKDAFPDIEDSHIIMGSAKNLVKFDVVLDDAPHNILKSCADYPVVFRQPWNAKLSGVLAVNSYDDFLTLIDQIKESMVEEKKVPTEPSIVCLVGPSGSNKNALANELCEGNFDKAVNDNVFSRDAIVRTVYAGKEYSLAKNLIEDSLYLGRNVIVPVDMCGAMALKRLFPNTILIFCKRSRENMIADILDRNISNEEKKIRLLSMEAEIRNKKLCEFVVDTENISAAADKIKKLFQ